MSEPENDSRWRVEADRAYRLAGAGFRDSVARDEVIMSQPINKYALPAFVRDTAGAIGLAAAILDRMDDQATMAVVTADQMIQPVSVFQQALKDALCFVGSHPRALVTFGINPTHPATTYGYIKCKEGQSFEGCDNVVHEVDSFREKPDEATAQSYLDHGQYYWNSGLFVWKARRILELIHCFLPDAREPLLHLGEAWGTPEQTDVLNTWFVRLPKISIDFAVMEKAHRVMVVELKCEWLDVGSWPALQHVSELDEADNVIVASKTAVLDSFRNIIISEDDHLVAVLGLDDCIVVHSSDATLVCDKSDSERLKELVVMLEAKFGGEYV